VIAVAGMAAKLLPARRGHAGSDCIHDAGETEVLVGRWMYQDHFLQADF